ncbi:ABC transporter permease subunit [Alkalibacter saccharofermentans]|uniref:Branched-chain amino acid transport system / permease component n=1 Tax=Alkalibacter saccharofermentans DSM 14828 TaxID=1120975 RepID=A0A1M4W3I0_9FIRM|nr:hypothetical protein [Alkalibacter saccharofermentans]SHE75776.1 Branched-chain amino acid transport system / permease component [Alkalibacter saccharofermentans DSM 14828]
MEAKTKLSNTLKNALKVLAFPMMTYLIMEGLVYMLMGRHLITSTLDIRNLVRDTGISVMIAFALSLNLGSGRFDLSLGAQRLIATIIGGNIAISLGFGGIGILVVAMLFGLFSGFLVGIVFITFRVPPVILGIGMALIYESIAFAGSSGQGLRLFGVSDVQILVDPTFTILVLSIVTILIFALFTYSKFRYDMQAVKGSQKIAIASGINVFKHVVICYTIGGGLVAIAGIFSAAFTGSLTPVLGMSSNGTVISMAFPMFVGLYLARKSNVAIGIILGTLSLKFFSIGLTALRLSGALTSAINMIAFIGFLVFLANKDLPKRRKAELKRIKQVKEKKKQLMNDLIVEG